MTKDAHVPPSEMIQRRARVQEELRRQDIDGLLVVQQADLSYLSDGGGSGVLYLPAEGEPLLAIEEPVAGPHREASIRNVVEVGAVQDIPGVISDFYGHLPLRLGFELDVLPVNGFSFYQELFNEQKCVDASMCILKARMFKSAWEIEQMDRAAEFSRKTFEYMKEIIRPGLTEIEFAGIFEAFACKVTGEQIHIRVRDCRTEGYPWHVLSGKSGGMVGLLDSPATGEGTSAAFPCGAGNKTIEAHEPIMVDFAFESNGYHSDETRMFSIGSMPNAAMKASEAAIDIHDSVLEKVEPGIPVAELFQYSVSKADSLGYINQYLGPPGYKVSFIGHGIGLELIERPIIARGGNECLEAGMTFALEPKMVFEDQFASGIESVFLVTENGHRSISRVPVEVFIC